METVTVRELRNNGGEVLDRVERGETLLVTKNGRPVAELRPTPRKPLTGAELLEAFRDLPPIDYDAFRRDVDSVIDQNLDTTWDSEG